VRRWRSNVDQFNTADALCCCGTPALRPSRAVVTVRNRQPPGNEGHPDHEYRIRIEYAASVQKTYDLGANGFLLFGVDAQVIGPSRILR
jgi:hypothetical protein